MENYFAFKFRKYFLCYLGEFDENFWATPCKVKSQKCQFSKLILKTDFQFWTFLAKYLRLPTQSQKYSSMKYFITKHGLIFIKKGVSIA